MSPIFPKEGTRAHEEFMRRARDPNSTEARMMKQVVGDATDQTQQVVRKMLVQMIELVPGQLFRDIARFHEKFGLSPTNDPGHKLPDDVLRFRFNFLKEELNEYLDAVGGREVYCPDHQQKELDFTGNFNVEKAFDALIDLAYVCLGTAYLHRFPFNEGWDRVQAANMAKVRADSGDDPRSVRKHKTDVVKPEGWKPPVLEDLLDEPCPACLGQGDQGTTWFSKDPPMKPVEFLFEFCERCKGSGRRKRIPEEEKCRMCNGTGDDIGCMHVGLRPPCESCGGTGRRALGDTACGKCHGSGRDLGESHGVVVSCELCGGTGRRQGGSTEKAAT